MNWKRLQSSENFASETQKLVVTLQDHITKRSFPSKHILKVS